MNPLSQIIKDLDQIYADMRASGDFDASMQLVAAIRHLDRAVNMTKQPASPRPVGRGLRVRRSDGRWYTKSAAFLQE